MRETTVRESQAMSAADVLAAFRDMHRHQAALYQADPTAELDRGTSIEEWRDACDLVPARQLGLALNDWFEIRLSDSEWLSVLEAPGATLGDVCELIARDARLPASRPVRLLGVSCSHAGVFLALRTLLAGRGARIAAIRPSTRIAEIPPEHALELVWTVGRLAPGVLPPPVIEGTFAQKCSTSLLWGSFALLLSALVASSDALGVGALLGVVAGVFGTGITHRLPPKTVRYEGLGTLGDLAKAIVKHRATGPGEP